MTKKLNSFFELLLFGLLIIITVHFALSPTLPKSVLDGLNLFFACVLPSLFPFFIITACFSSLKITGKLSNLCSPLSKRLFNTNGSAFYALFISLISGYPMGSKVVSDLKNCGALSNSESVRASAFCSTSSPMFLISSVGAFMFNDVLFGVCLFLSHLLSAITIGVIFSFYKRKDKPQNTNFIFSPQKVDDFLGKTVFSAVNSALIVGGMITLFYLITQTLLSLNVLSPVINFVDLFIKNEQVSKGLVLGFFECTQGLKSVASMGVSLPTLFACAIICGFGGLSVIFQSLVYLKSAKIKTAPFFIAKILMAVISCFYCAIFYSILF